MNAAAGSVGWLVLILILSTPADAWAYVDPGTGSYLFQLALAGFLAGAYTLRRYWLTVKMVVLGRRGRDRAVHPGEDGN